MKKFLICICLFAATIAALSLTSCKKNKAEEEIRTPVTVEIPFVSDFTCDYYDASGNRIASRSTVFEPDDEIRVKFGFSLSSDAFAEEKRNFTLKLTLSDGFDGRIMSANSSSTSDKNLTATYTVDDRNAKQCEIEVRINFHYSSGNFVVSYSYDDEDFSDVLTLPLNNDKTLLFTYNESADGYVVEKDRNKSEWLTQVKILNLPDTYAGKPIVAIAENTFADCGSLTRIEIPNGVASMGLGAFKNCSSLTSIKIPDKVTIIENRVFYGCSSLNSVILPDSVNEINCCAFEGCSNLRNITLSVRQIGERAFKNCGLETVTMGSRLVKISKSAFSGCGSLTSIIMPDSVTSIGASAFSGCGSLASVTISSGVSTIAENVFGGCKNLTSVVIPDSVTNIGSGAFSDCPIERITMPISAISSIPLSKLKVVKFTSGDFVDNYIFRNHGSLESVTLPDGVTSIGAGTFLGCGSLSSVENAKNLISIGKNAFNGCGSLVNFEMGENVESIGENAFYGCKSLQEIKIPEYITSINHYTFCGCGSLKSVEIPDRVVDIGINSFYGCSSLTSVKLGKSVKYIVYNSFGGCGNLNNIEVDANNVNFSSIDGDLYKKDADELVVYARGKTNTEFVVPSSVTSIFSMAFSGCKNLKSVSLSRVKGIYGCTFENCTALTSVTIPDSVDSIAYDAFRGCDNLKYNEYGNSRYLGNAIEPYYALIDAADAGVTAVDIKEGTRIIADKAFYNCTDLTRVTFSNKVAKIGESAFEGCENLTDIDIPDSMRIINDRAFSGCGSFTSVIIPDGVTSIGANAFSDCVKLASVTIGKGVKTIEESTFGGCSSLTSVNMSAVTKISSYAFKDCIGLESVNIPSTVTSIGNAFKGCVSLSNIVVDEGNVIFNSIDGNLYQQVEYVGMTLVQYAIGKADTQFTIPDGVVSIWQYAFDGSENLTSISISSSVTRVSGIKGCYNLSNILVEGADAAYKSIDGVLYSKSGTTLVLYPMGKKDTQFTVSDDVTYIGAAAFNDCKNLTSITIGKTVNDIGSGAFSGCANLQNFKVADNNGYYTSIDGNLYTKSWGRYKLVQYALGKTNTEFTVPSNVTGIYSGAFNGCENLTTVKMGDSVDTIEGYAFNGCKNLVSVTFSSALNSIGENIFYDCENLTSITIPIGITEIGHNSFRLCGNLTSVYYEGTRSEWLKIASKSGSESDSGKTTIICSDGEIKFDFNGLLVA